jgi:uncharacterized membrane protein YedE/YeeE
MKYVKYILVGIVFGITLTKAEVISWYRIYEMFKFQSFHMYGVIGSAVILGIIFVQLIKRNQMKSLEGEQIKFTDKNMSIPRYLIGGAIFGLGWAMIGACPGPMFILLGNGFLVIIVAILAAILGTYTYGKLRSKLPH